MRPYTNTILLAEDDPDDRECYRESFLNKHYNEEVVIVDNGSLLLQILRNMEDNLPSLLVIDNLLPDFKAEALLQVLKTNERYKDIPVLVITGRHTPALEQHLKHLGALDCLEKPFTFADWDALVEKLLRLSSRHENRANPYQSEEAA